MTKSGSFVYIFFLGDSGKMPAKSDSGQIQSVPAPWNRAASGPIPC